MIPGYLTHYYIQGRKPFQTISDLSPQELVDVIDNLNKVAASGNSRRLFPDWYVDERKKIEAYLRCEFIKKGGKPIRDYPLYLCFGSSELFRNVTLNTMEIRVSISDIPDEVISFTFQDSMISMEFKNEYHIKKIYHGEVYTKTEIYKLIDKFGFPEDNFEEYKNEKFINYIEAQLWSDEPIKHLI